MKAFNLHTNQEIHFDASTTPEWAVAYGYCAENNLMSALFKSAQDKKFPEFLKTLPTTRGQVSIACGDWAASLVTPTMSHGISDNIRPSKRTH